MDLELVFNALYQLLEIRQSYGYGTAMTSLLLKILVIEEKQQKCSFLLLWQTTAKNVTAEHKVHSPYPEYYTTKNHSIRFVLLQLFHSSF